MKEKAHGMSMTQAIYLEHLLLDTLKTPLIEDSKVIEPVREEGISFSREASKADVLSSLEVQAQHLKNELEKKGYWIKCLTAVNEALNYQNEALEARIKQLELAITKGSLTDLSQ